MADTRAKERLQAAGLDDSSDDDDDAPAPAPAAAAHAPEAAQPPSSSLAASQPGKSLLAAAGLDSDSDSDDDNAPAPAQAAPAARPTTHDDNEDDEDDDFIVADDADDDGGPTIPRKGSLSAAAGAAGMSGGATAADGEIKHMETNLLQDQMVLSPHTQQVLFKTSNIVGVAPVRFDPSTHEREKTAFTDETGKSRVILNDNVVRWRVDPKQPGARQSNARFIRWSDGSLQLQVGNEVFNVAEHPVEHEKGYVFVRHSNPTMLQSRGPCDVRLNFLPSSLKSRSHRALTDAIEKKHAKEAKVTRVATLMDPEVEKKKMEEEEAKRIQQERRGTQRQEKTMRRATSGYARAGRAGRPETTFVGYEDEEDDEMFIDDGDEEEDDDDLRRGGGGAAGDARLTAAKEGGTKRRREVNDEEELFDDDDEPGAGAKRVYISDDDSD
ncbi:hypothetical protein PPROV_000522000 [Pycnococcus provasolii]|uniref:RNA polymerase-associated protein LEO1 n=1 Tax=Pycnococcus provasolii TaxID=41880 RepID=A0A830HI53_9CHLO|nr:hypothetical protein PPROV_000522000 [Pycnococcus provasolii]